jgi:hypothetical protein
MMGGVIPESQEAERNSPTKQSRPTTKLKPAEPSLSRVLGAFGSIRRKHHDKPKKMPHDNHDDNRHHQTQQHEAAIEPEPRDSMSVRSSSMQQAHHNSLTGALRQALAPASTLPAPDTSSFATEPPLGRARRQSSTKTTESKNGKKFDSSILRSEVAAIKQNVTDLMRRGSSRGVTHRAGRGGATTRDPVSQNPDSAIAIGRTTAGMDTASPEAIGTRYSIMEQGTPPVIQDPVRPTQILPAEQLPVAAPMQTNATSSQPTNLSSMPEQTDGVRRRTNFGMLRSGSPVQRRRPDPAKWPRGNCRYSKRDKRF